MRVMIKAVLLAAGLAALAVLGTPVLAFHDGGVAACNGCHTMHASAGNPSDTPGGNPFLLKQSNSTDTCSRCHDTNYGNTWGTSVSSPGKVVGGGQFIFLLEDNLNDGHNGSLPANWIPGRRAGHNIVSIDKGTVADSDHGTSPGGTYDSNYMHCTSCHDPHGQGGHFRLLYGTPYNSEAMGYEFDYTSAAPEAAGISLFGGGESKTSHTAYKSGMSEWCANCHGNFHSTVTTSPLKHPAGVAMGAEIADNYNKYNGSGHYDGTQVDAYIALVPFEDATASTTSAGGPSETSQVMCLSCHRAHASSAPFAGRWDFNITFWEEEGVESGSYAITNPYAATAGVEQRSLCNKCHAKDPA